MRAGFLALCVLAAACGPGRQTSGSYSFEGSLQGWRAGAIDAAADAPGGWSIAAASDEAFDGAWSARFFVDNQSGSTKMFLSRAYALKPFQAYDVHFEFALGTSDGDRAAAFRVLAGAARSPPENGDAAISLVQDDTGSAGGSGLSWVVKSYDTFATTGPEGDLSAIVGIWATSEATRTYYLDALAVVFTERRP